MTIFDGHFRPKKDHFNPNDLKMEYSTDVILSEYP